MGAEGIYPENWKEMIRGKKVILYNTGVSGLLHGQEYSMNAVLYFSSSSLEMP